MSKIQLVNITKIFKTKENDVHAVRKASLHIEEKDIFGVIGFSGAGKSTLIRCINLLERPTEGEVVIDGKNLMDLSARDLRAERKKIGMIFQHFNLMRSRTVAQNIAFPLKGSGLSKEQINKKVDELLELVELKDKKKAYPSQLSGGQKQRVAIARALANDPSILLCDEATSALDPQTTQSILALLKNLNEKLKITIVIITHEMAVVKAICNKVAIMEDGNIVEEGNIIDIFTKPKSEVTRTFINTTTSIHQIYELIEKNDPLVDLDVDETMLRLVYSSSNTKEALMTYLVKTYDVSFNIIFGNVEVLANSPLGNLVVKLKGEKANIESAITYIKGQGVGVEVLK
ncbi:MULTISPECIES: ATP-binding cassette domain-containing protein [unclassified Breznakia]|uniref:methionine ABC transporter ATP-binding protein n=1 Tax=unclassified Breznakia TaxID=2623764 RepID=UPI002405AF1B|nr:MULTISPECIES: ATP-binding cassette domain-containing protein [unclassified Breznakia]